MKSIVTSVFAALLFIALTPGVLLRLPPKGSKQTVLLVHTFVFFIIYYLLHGMIYRFFNPMRQGFSGAKKVSFSNTTDVKEPFKAANQPKAVVSNSKSSSTASGKQHAAPPKKQNAAPANKQHHVIKQHSKKHNK